MAMTAAAPRGVVSKQLADLYKGCIFWVQIGSLWHHLEATSHVAEKPHTDPRTGEGRVLLVLNAITVNPSPGEANRMGFQQWAEPLPDEPGFWVDPKKYAPPVRRKRKRVTLNQR